MKQRGDQQRAGARRLTIKGLVGLALPLVAAIDAVATNGCEVLVDGELGPVGCNDVGAFGPPACPVGQTCVGQLCTDVGLPWGQPCSLESDRCAWPARCDGAALAPPDSSPLCTAPCCVSSDCGPARFALVCHARPSGAGNACWPAELLGRPAPGASAPGESCGANSDCRSAQCIDGRCADSCCRDFHCGSTELVCGLHDGGATAPYWGCAKTVGTVGPNQPCNADAECLTGRCVTVSPQLRVCAKPCCSSAECGVVTVGAQNLALACAPWGDPAVQLCSRALPLTADQPLGESCTDAEQCRSGRCRAVAGAGSRCVDVCCVNTDCAALTGSSCEAVEESTVWTLQCVAK